MKTKYKIKFTTIVFLGIIMLNISNAQSKRYGIRTGINDNHKQNLNLAVYEIYLHTTPPLDSISKSIFGSSTTSFEVSAGALLDKKNIAFLISSGPVLELINYENIFSALAGIKQGLMTDHNFGNYDLGGNFNFLSFFELTITLKKQITLGYRFEHISNAGIYEKNPGINFHHIGLAYIK